VIKNTPLVGIYSPFPRSGKDEVKNVFLDAGYVEITFARVVKSTMKFFLMELGLTEEMAHWHLYDAGKEESIDILDNHGTGGMTGGQLLSTFATDYMRDMVDNRVWLERAIEDAKEYLLIIGEPKGFITSDLRFMNEYAECDITIRLTRKGVTEHSRSTKSEGNLENVPHDYQIVNNGSLDELKLAAHAVVMEIENEDNN